MILNKISVFMPFDFVILSNKFYQNFNYDIITFNYDIIKYEASKSDHYIDNHRIIIIIIIII